VRGRCRSAVGCFLSAGAAACGTQKVQALVNAYLGLVGGEPQTKWSQNRLDVTVEVLRVGTAAVDHHHEVVRVADQAVGSGFALLCAPALGLGAHRQPAGAEVLIEGRQSNVGQQQRQDSSNPVGNFCFEVSLTCRRVERPRRVNKRA
jgi:hypothetical protein